VTRAAGPWPAPPGRDPRRRAVTRAARPWPAPPGRDPV